MRRLCLLAIAALVSGCGESSSSGDGNDALAETPARAALAMTGSGAPRRAAGLWSLKTIGAGGTVVGTQQLCVDTSSEEKASVFDQIARNTNCSKYAIVPGEEAWSFEFVCCAADMTTTTKGKVEGDFTGSYTVQVSESDGSMEMSRTIEASRTGDCPAGVTPGSLLDEQGALVADITR